VRPKIEETWFGSITVDGRRYEHDVIIRLSGKVRKRNKQLSKAVYGTSHILSLDEIRDLYRKDARHLIIGAGQEGEVKRCEVFAQLHLVFARQQIEFAIPPGISEQGTVGEQFGQDIRNGGSILLADAIPCGEVGPG